MQRKNEANWIESRERWQINVQQDGERKTFSSSTLGKKGKIEAERKADEWLKAKHQNLNARFDSLYKEFLDEILLLTSKTNYIKHEQIGRLWLAPHLKFKRVVAITEQDWQNCINAAYKAGKYKKTLQNIRAVITKFTRYARKRGIPMHRPEFLDIPKDAPEKEKKILQPSGLKTLFAHDTIRQYGKDRFVFFIYAFRFIVLTGVRRGELCALKKRDVKDGFVSIRGSVNTLNQETRGKNDNARRWFALSQHAKDVLQKQAEMLKEKGVISPYLFPDEFGERLDPNHLYKCWYTYRKQHGIKSSLHEMRHTLISVAKADVPEQLLKRTVGHSQSMDTFGVYGHDVQGEMERVAGILDEIFSKTLE